MCNWGAHEVHHIILIIILRLLPLVPIMESYGTHLMFLNFHWHKIVNYDWYHKVITHGCVQNPNLGIGHFVSYNFKISTCMPKHNTHENDILRFVPILIMSHHLIMHNQQASLLITWLGQLQILSYWTHSTINE